MFSYVLHNPVIKVKYSTRTRMSVVLVIGCSTTLRPQNSNALRMAAPEIRNSGYEWAIELRACIIFSPMPCARPTFPDGSVAPQKNNKRAI